MEYKTITAVGIDVSKGKSTIAVRRPGGEVALVPFQVNHDAAGLSGLVKTLRGIDGDIRGVMEYTAAHRPGLERDRFFRQCCQRHAYSRFQR